jgi:methylenetetrahydrofolate dehydrogenase (NADP+)/methenyltetrahydrofolate cyclohydrolase
MTVAMLLVNTVLAWCERHGLDTTDLADLRP